MRLVIDIECNALVNPSEIWLIVCKDIDTGEFYYFRNVTSNEEEKQRFLKFIASATLLIGHNILGYDYPVLNNLTQFTVHDVWPTILDTLVVSKLVDFPRKGHSIESYGEEFGIEKGNFHLWGDKELYNPKSPLYLELETYCTRDVNITHKVYLKYLKYLERTLSNSSLELEHRFQYYVVNNLERNGFKFNVSKAQGLLKLITAELLTLDAAIAEAFPQRLKLIREITPKVTKHGTLSRSDFRWLGSNDLTEFNGGPFCRCHWVQFNPSSHKQLVDVLHEAHWMPEDKTTTHISVEREVNRLKYNNRLSKEERELALAEHYAKLKTLEKYGWKINEKNLSTLPDTAPLAAHSLAKRILLESRRRTLTEWIELVGEDLRIHGKFYGIGAWTHRMAHQQPNTANIPNEFDTEGKVKLLGKEMRQLWCAPKNRLLVGVDAEGIQLRIFAHYINDKEFTDALINGRKADKTDPHSLNQRILGSVCRSRAAAKRFIYALLLGAGSAKLSQILGCSSGETQEALDRLLKRYTGWETLRREEIPKDARNGYFVGLDGRKVKIPGDTQGERKHLCMSGYLQNGEAVVMKKATLHWMKDLDNDPELDRLLLSKRSSIIKPREKGAIASRAIFLVNFVHDEWQTETPNNMEIALRVAQAKCKALEYVGQELELKCPLAGSYWNEDHHDYTIGTNWYQTH